jgi:hypothetical protein
MPTPLDPQLAEGSWPFGETDTGITGPEDVIVFADYAQGLINEARESALPSVDELAQIIRKVDGNHTLGAGALAEAILDTLTKP